MFCAWAVIVSVCVNVCVWMCLVVAAFNNLCVLVYFHRYVCFRLISCLFTSAQRNLSGFACDFVCMCQCVNVCLGRGKRYRTQHTSSVCLIAIWVYMRRLIENRLVSGRLEKEKNWGEKWGRKGDKWETMREERRKCWVKTGTRRTRKENKDGEMRKDG